MFCKLPGVKKPESPVDWIFGLFILYLSKKIERRRNAVLTKTKGFYDSGIIICGADRFVNLPAHKKLKALIIKCIKMDKISKSEIFRGDIQKRKSENVPDAD